MKFQFLRSIMAGVEIKHEL